RLSAFRRSAIESPYDYLRLPGPACSAAGPGRILEPPPDRGCVRRTSRSKCGCPKSPNDPKTRGLAVPLRLVLRTQPRSVSARFWWLVPRCAREPSSRKDFAFFRNPVFNRWTVPAERDGEGTRM